MDFNLESTVGFQGIFEHRPPTKLFAVLVSLYISLTKRCKTQLLNCLSTHVLSLFTHTNPEIYRSDMQLSEGTGNN